MKEMGWPRPTCEECGLIELDERGIFIVNFINQFWPVIVSQSPLGEGYSVNGEMVFSLAKGEVDNLKVLLKFIIAYIDVYMGDGKGEE